MGNVVIDMSMSLDGYIAPPNDNPEADAQGQREARLPARRQLAQVVAALSENGFPGN